MENKFLKIYIDGASSGNPGPSSIGIIIYDQNNNIIKQISENIGITTNNVAEYCAAITALIEILNINCNNVEIYSDSELLVRQISGKYKVKAPKIIPLHFILKNLVKTLKQVQNKKIHFINIPREKNKYADKLAKNKTKFFTKCNLGSNFIL